MFAVQLSLTLPLSPGFQSQIQRGPTQKQVLDKADC